jgi:hypothetical protein
MQPNNMLCPSNEKKHDESTTEAAVADGQSFKQVMVIIMYHVAHVIIGLVTLSTKKYYIM